MTGVIIDMVRTHKRKAGSRNYKTAYSQDNVKDAVRDVKTNGMSLRKASKKYKIPLGTLRNKVIGAHSGNVGRPAQLDEECVKQIAKCVDILADWKVPLSGSEVCLLVKGYLDAKGAKSDVFKNNLPGPDWLENFTKKNNFSQRFAGNVKINRAEVSPEVINTYFDHLDEALKDHQGTIFPANIYNYNETNITDNPGAKKVLVRRGRRRVERKAEHSKQAISMMFCGNADGNYLPPMVVYKAKNVYLEWCTGGPAGTVFECSRNGWFDSRTFEMWFLKIFLPNATERRLSAESPILLLGDNLPSHFSTLVIEECLKHNIIFITMPANATHLCQPLDVAVFGPLKRSWREILNRWRKDTRRKGTIPKTQFPGLLKQLCETLSSHNLKSGFRGTGLFPLDRTQVLKRLPSTPSNEEAGNGNDSAALNESVMNFLQIHCGIGKPAENKKSCRGRKIVPGKPILSLPGTSSESASAAAQDSGAGEQWICNTCKASWEAEGDDRWIVCDVCSRQYHLQCSGVEYETENYYTFDIEGFFFECDEC